MIKNILFDLGGVLYNVQYQKTVEEFAELTESRMVFSQESELSVIADFERGLITADEFRRELLFAFGYKDPIENEKFDNAWNSMLMGVYEYAIPLVRTLKQNGHTIALLSNINELHYEYVEKQCDELLSLFDDIYLSYKIGKRKPDSEVFTYVIDNSKWKSEETLYIDDASRHIESAKKNGLNTLLWQQKEYSSTNALGIIEKAMKQYG